jgi:nicotinate-nucleotide pyrophosphorylase (carboxylating)
MPKMDTPLGPISRDLEALIDRALAEDLSAGDPTTDALIPSSQTCRGVIIAKAEGVLAGTEAAATVIRRLDPSLTVHICIPDGSRLKHGDAVLEVSGRLASILTAERTALNLIQRLSGIATLTRRYVDAIAGTRARIVDTRKTTPGLRVLEKHAVRMGGGQNHRRNLGDGILIKDNHIAACQARGMSIADIVKAARQHAPHTLKVEIEVTSLDQMRQALDAGADIIMLDNMPVEKMRQAVAIAKVEDVRPVGSRALLEASGGVNLQTVRAIAETGVDLISVGALTHSAPALDLSLEVTHDSAR